MLFRSRHVHVVRPKSRVSPTLRPDEEVYLNRIFASQAGETVVLRADDDWKEQYSGNRELSPHADV